MLNVRFLSLIERFVKRGMDIYFKENIKYYLLFDFIFCIIGFLERFVYLIVLMF